MLIEKLRKMKKTHCLFITRITMERNYSVKDVTNIILRGDIKTLMEIKNICEKRTKHFVDALSMNRFDIFIFLYNSNWPRDYYVDFIDIRAETILHYNLNAMKYLHSKGYSFDRKEYAIIAVGRINFKLPPPLHEFIEDSDLPPPEDQKGLQMIQFLREVSCPITEDSYISASVSGNIECVRYLNEYCHCPWHVSTTSCAIIGRKLDVLLYSATNGAPITPYVNRFLHLFNFQSLRIKESGIIQKYFDIDCESVILSFLEIDRRGFKGPHMKKDKRFIRNIKKGIGDLDFIVPHPRLSEIDIDGDYGISTEY
jgi:hypothetical protein